MKLISKFHDYYDTALAEGRDESIVYVRERSLASTFLSEDIVPWAVKRTGAGRYGGSVGGDTVFITDKANFKGRSWLGRYGEEQEAAQWRFDEGFVVIAGKATPIWVRYGSGKALLGEMAADHVGDPSLEHLKAEMERIQAPSAIRTNKTPEVVVRPGKRDEKDSRSYAAARERLLAHDFTHLHLQTGAPVLLITSLNTLYERYGDIPEVLQPGTATGVERANLAIVLNPRLVDLGFPRVAHPYTCFQAISQFIGGVIPGQQMPMATISDKSQVLKKGFDPIYGFRKRPASQH